ncbi:desmethyl-deoxy-podophyllotoxin synthase-like [Rosa rugosa]|uniref:desmethyl-deoxy-podophyllotoxin synthase-like n=1 Tax=Rosa rugosa TaxID=74645 RepID=UPI002B40E2B4|nr:desmethyl-deoxy-podophyllotoxin synthase-like [Rosa rugosa]
MLQIHNVPSLPLYTSLIALVILVLYRKRLKSSHTSSLSLPPGPRKLPVIGNLLQLVGSLPHHSLRDLAKRYGPIMHIKVGQVSAVVISSPELAEEVLRTHETAFSQRPTVFAIEVLSYDLSSILFCPNNDYWRQMRKICVSELLSTKRVHSFASIREEEAWNLVETVYSSASQPQLVVNLSGMVFSMQNGITARAALGKKCKHEQEFTSLIDEINQLAGGFAVPDLFPSLKFLRHVTRFKPPLEKIHGKMDRMLDEIINDHKVKRESSAGDDPLQEDIVDVLLQLQECSDQIQLDVKTKHIKAITMDMYTSGSETSATTTEWAMAELVRNPRVMEKAQAEIRQLLAGKKKIHDADIKKLDYLKLVVKETLRLHPPLALIARQATQTCKISGYDIPSETKLLVNAWAIGRDRRHWGASADCFEPERFQGSSIDFKGTNFEFIPFGAGKRMCPGISFGTASVEIALA